MKQQHYILLTLILFTSQVSKCFGTEQIPESLIFKSDTFLIFTEPLEELPYIGTLRPKIFGKKEGCITTACWKGYSAEWIIENNHLYLTGIYSCCYFEDKIKADLKSLFGDKCVNGKVKADWFSGSIIAKFGKGLFYVHYGYGYVYKKEYELKLINGQFIEKKEFDNSKSRKSQFTGNDLKLTDFIQSNINWNNLPKLDDKKITVWVQFSANEKGKIDSVKVLKGYNSIFDNEAIRVLKAIPEWDIVYKKGKFERIHWKLPVKFTEENRKKYNLK